MSPSRGRAAGSSRDRPWATQEGGPVVPDPNMSSDGNASKDPTTVSREHRVRTATAVQAQGAVSPGGAHREAGPARRVPGERRGNALHHRPGRAGRRHRQLAEGRRTRARRCSRTSTSARRSRTSTTSASRSGSCTPAAPGAHGVFEVYELAGRVHHGRLPQRPGRRDAGLRAVLDRRPARAARPTPSRDVRGFATKFYTERGQLRPGRQQHAGLLHPGRASSSPTSSTR